MVALTSTADGISPSGNRALNRSAVRLCCAQSVTAKYSWICSALEQSGDISGTTDGTTGSGTFDMVTSVGAAISMDWTSTSDGTTTTATVSGETTLESSGLVIPVAYDGTFTY